MKICPPLSDLNQVYFELTSSTFSSVILVPTLFCSVSIVERLALLDQYRFCSDVQRRLWQHPWRSCKIVSWQHLMALQSSQQHERECYHSSNFWPSAVIRCKALATDLATKVVKDICRVIKPHNHCTAIQFYPSWGLNSLKSLGSSIPVLRRNLIDSW